MKLYKTLIILLVIGLVLINGCSQPKPESAPKQAAPAQIAPVESPAAPQAIPAKSAEVKEFNMTAKQFEFVPNTITVNNGDTVKLHIVTSDVAHGFNLPDFGINKKIVPGKAVDVEFAADKTGTFAFSCNIPCGLGHREMKGNLVVK